MAALVIALGGAGYSATGGNFILGQLHSASTQTKLVAPLNAAAFRIENSNIGPSAAGVTIITDASRPPLVVNSTAKVANLNADKLDGLDSTGFVQGAGIVEGQAVDIVPGLAAAHGPTVGGLVFLQYICPGALATNGTLKIRNASSTIANFFVDNGGGNPTYTQVAPSAFVDFAASAAGDAFSIQAQGAPGVMSIQVATVHRNASNDCHAQAVFVLAK